MTSEEPQRSQDGSFSDDSPFVRVLRKEGRVRILDVFLRKHYSELNASEVSTLSGVSDSTFSRNIDELLDLGIVEESSKAGNTQYYELNKENEVSKVLGKAQRELLKHSDKITRNTKRPHQETVLNHPGEQDEKKEINEQSQDVAESLVETSLKS